MSIFIINSITFTFLHIGQSWQRSAGVAERLQVSSYLVELVDVVLQLNDKALRTWNKDDMNLDEFSIVGQLARFEFNEWIVETES